MKKIYTTLMIVFGLALAHGADKAPTASLVKALANVETGCDETQPRTQYQFTRAVWEQHSSMPWDYARKHPTISKVRSEANMVAIAHVEWIKSRLEANNKPVTINNVSLCFRIGVTAFLRGDINMEHRDYAMRVSNLVLTSNEI